MPITVNDQKLDIIINLLKQGSGGKEAAAEISQLDESQKKAAKSSADLSGLMTSLKATIAGLGIAAIIRESVQAFEQQEQAVAKLDGTLRAAGRYTAEFSKEMKELADSLEGVTRFDDTKILGAVTQLLGAGAGKGEIERLTRLTLDFAAAMGTDAESAAISLGKALQGEFTMFSRFGIQIDETKGKAAQLHDVLAQLEKRFSGIAQAQGATASGAIVQFKNNVDDLKKALGEFIVVGLNPYLSAINEIVKASGAAAGSPGAIASLGTDALNLKRKDALMKELGEARASGMIGFKEMDALQSQLQEAFNRRKTVATDYGGDSPILEQTSDTAAENAAISAAMGSLRPDLKRSAKPEPNAGDKLALEDRKKGLIELAKLQADISLGTLEGFDKERGAALQTYDERIKALDKIKAMGVDVSDDLVAAEEERSSKFKAIWEKESAQAEAKAHKEIEAQRRATDEIRKIQEQLSLDSISSSQAMETGYGKASEQMASAQRKLDLEEKRQFFEASIRHDELIVKIRELAAEKRLSADAEQGLMVQATAAYELQRQAIAKTIEEQKRQQFWLSDTGQLVTQINQQFASGFSRAFVDFASGAKNAEDAFKEFGASFLQTAAQMIMQMLVLRAISGIFGGLAGGASATTGIDGAAANPIANFNTPLLAAGGGQFPRLMAGGGMQGMVHQATYLPRFNAITGEAGSELLTVMARPRMFEMGGMTGTIGDVGGSRMAVLPERALNAAAGGVEVIVRMEPGLRAEIVSESVQGAVVRVTNDVGRSTPLSSGIKKLVA